MEETFQQLVPIANHQHLVATLFCKLWDCAYAINPESPSLSLRLKARKVCLNVGPALVFRTEKPHPQQFYFGLSFDPSALEIAVVDRLYELSGAEPFRFKNKLFGAVYLGYVSRDIEEVQEIAMPGVLVFVSRAAEQKNTHPASHNQKLLEFLRRTALSNETHQKGQQRRAVQNRFLACLLGGAVGDALGAPVEGMKRSQILRRFGPKGITNYAPAFSGVGKITANTQMALFTAEGLLRTWVRGCFKGIGPNFPMVMAHSYLRWLRTQGELPMYGEDLRSAGNEPGWLFKQAALHSHRTKSTTSLTALKRMRFSWSMDWVTARNNNKGSGAVVRIAPLGLFSWRWQHEQQDKYFRDEMSDENTFALGAHLASLTHGHPSAAMTAGVFAVLILALTDGATLLDGLATAESILRRQPRHEETLSAIEHAKALARSDVPRDAAIAKLGEGWVAEEALAISVYCALVARTFKEGVILAVNHDGDSNSTGSITGNLLGTMLGAKAIPQEWLGPLELRDVIAELAEDLYAFRDWDIDGYSNNQLSRRIWRKYPGF